ncbi:ScbA/BarX family gamma-butyrolactone biosynthesis protein [Streptomyces sp. ISL-100]|uniref:ScbA/BarX family gamma-butyrolactone biosynthesis protein n=1 Tax=Streptomyces sp. ISL-100 TaxID=2819173 RepID=UPI001BE7112E|nr:ScbA/BarX family gamma-butyrolactone biosynthesis protein [Streptomyces sp. ISL-100]MBT2399299.1 gamma-butyrolactone biosynthesis protein [Streptomyces sp. ISL-100]
MSISTSSVIRTAGAAPLRQLLRYDQTVPRTLVHRAAVAEVFLTDGCRLEDMDRFLIAAQWPRSHGLYEPDAAGFTDPVLLVETVRQAAIYTAHRFHEVPLAHRFIFCDLDLQIEEPALLRVGGAPLRAVLDGRFTPEANQSAKRFGARFEAVIRVNGQRCGRASVRLLAVGDQLYTMLRHRDSAPAGGPLPPRPRTLLPAAEVGQVRPENVLLSSEGPGTYGVHLDTEHPGYFEHASDHVPGMALVEAFRQAGHQLLRQSGNPRTQMMTACEVAFGSFGELDAPLLIQAYDASSEVAPGNHVVRMTATQGERTLARATSVYRPQPAASAR